MTSSSLMPTTRRSSAREPFTGPDATDDFAVPPLPAGEYTFYCEFHPVPEMTGTLIVE